jgi:hypothetical protein
MISEPTIVDWQAFMLVGLPDQSVERGLNCFCEQLDSELTDEIPDGEQRARAVISAAEAVCTRMGEFQSCGIGRA